MKAKIEQALQAIIGRPLWSIGRAGNLQWFEFGNERREVTMRNGKSKIVGEYALHLECAWRIRNQNKILFALRDLYYPAGDDIHKNLDKFEWDTQGSNQLDERVSKFFDEIEKTPLIPLSVCSDNMGGFCLTFNDGYFLEVFIDNSLDIDHWRLFQPYREAKHFVVTGHGIEYE